MKKSERRKLVLSVIQHICLAGIFACLAVNLLFLGDYGIEGISASRYTDTENFQYYFEDYVQMAAESVRYGRLFETDGELDLDKELAVEIYGDGEYHTLHYRLGDLVLWMNRGVSGEEVGFLEDTALGQPADYGRAGSGVRHEGHAQDGQAQSVLEQVTRDAQNRMFGRGFVNVGGAGWAAEDVLEQDEAVEYAEDTQQQGEDGAKSLAPVSVYCLSQEYAPLEYGSLEEAAREWQLSTPALEDMYRQVYEQLSYYTDSIYAYQYDQTALAQEYTNFRWYAACEDGTAYTNMPQAAGVEEARALLQEAGAVYLEADTGLLAYEGVGASFGGNAAAYVTVRNWNSYTGDSLGYTWVCGVDTEGEAADVFAEDIRDYASGRRAAIAAIVLGILCAVGYVTCFAVLTVMAGHVDGCEGISLRLIDHWKTELELLLFGGLAAALLTADYVIVMGALSADESLVVPGTAAVCLAAVVSDTALMCGWLSLTRRLKAGNLYTGSFLADLVDSVSGCPSAWKAWAAYLVFLLANLFLVLLGFQAPLLIVAAAVADILLGAVLIREKGRRQRIVEGIERISGGDMDYQVPTEELKGDNLRLAQAVNHIREGLSNAVEKSLKSERLKTDLITNVSHDIKTPLTSIINYIDLIKRENIQDEKVQGYLEVLEAKSQRLKTLTEDLVEASKASSGNVTLEFINIDFVELVNQTNGEFAEKFAGRRLELVTSLPEPPVYVKADGRRLWRVVENLYSNVAKYAMEGTRVYVDLTADELEVAFSVKNISQQPLNIRADELTERFVRGDVSRSTEGSGLGLSIAKSLTELQHGEFEIYLDGDLFRVTVRFPRVPGAAKQTARDGGQNSTAKE